MRIFLLNDNHKAILFSITKKTNGCINKGTVLLHKRIFAPSEKATILHALSELLGNRDEG